MKKLLFIFLANLFSLAISAQTTKIDSGKVDWITLEQAKAKFAEKQKPILIYITDNKAESKAMEDTTFKLYEVTNYMNVRFYCVKIDAYTKEKITYMDGQVFENKTGGMHDFAKFILGQETKFPAMVLLNVDGYGASYFGYKDRDAIFPVLIYTSENVYRTTTYEDWFAHYDKTYPSKNTKGYTMTRSLVKWLTFEEAQEKNKVEKRKFFVDIYANWVVGATVMFIATYNNPEVAKILNEKYYPIRLNALDRDTIEVHGIKYFNRGNGNTYHDLPVAMLEGKMNFPAFLILNEEILPLSKYANFASSSSLEAILTFFYQDKYKTEIYKDFFEKFIKEKEKKN